MGGRGAGWLWPALSAPPQLWHAGRLGLDDRVAAHLPELAGSPLADRTLTDLLALCGAGADVLPAGARFKYSNVAYSLLGLVVARVSGEPYNS